MHSADPRRDSAAEAKVTALGIHQDALRRLIRRRENLPPQDDLLFASIFYKNYVFTQSCIGNVRSHSRWCIRRGDLTPFHVSPRELEDIIRYLHTKHALTTLDISEVLATDIRMVQAVVAGRSL